MSDVTLREFLADAGRPLYTYAARDRRALRRMWRCARNRRILIRCAAYGLGIE